MKTKKFRKLLEKRLTPEDIDKIEVEAQAEAKALKKLQEEEPLDDDNFDEHEDDIGAFHVTIEGDNNIVQISGAGINFKEKED
jgi:hypothetical protein